MGIFASGNTAVNIYGGTFVSNSQYDLLATTGATITLYGNFSQYGVISSNADGLLNNNAVGTITGTFQNGGFFGPTVPFPETLTYNVSSGGQIILAPGASAVPEVSPLALLGLGLPGLVLLARKRRPRTA